MTTEPDLSPDDPRLAGHPMLSKVRKLLAKAEDPAATPEEAES